MEQMSSASPSTAVLALPATTPRFDPVLLRTQLAAVTANDHLPEMPTFQEVAPPHFATVPQAQALRVLAQEEAEPSSAAETFPPQAAELAEPGAVEWSALEQAFAQFLQSVQDLERTLATWLRQLGPTPWILMGLALAGTAYTLVWRRQQWWRARLVRLDGDELQLDWWFGLPGDDET